MYTRRFVDDDVLRDIPIYKQVRHDATYYVGICFKKNVIDFMNEEDKWFIK